jgi:23S rRNA (cytidine1920-2'-O)/16S rRNA (cytidine1409-2'-O)-methyltransferase
MDKKLSANKRIELYEQTNFKDVTPSIFKERVELIVADLSFISITKILDKISELFDYSFEMVLLVKPQYELGKDIIRAYKGVIKTQRL